MRSINTKGTWRGLGTVWKSAGRVLEGSPGGKAPVNFFSKSELSDLTQSEGGDTFIWLLFGLGGAWALSNGASSGWERGLLTWFGGVGFCATVTDITGRIDRWRENRHKRLLKKGRQER